MVRFIDFHTHVYPEKIAAKATENVCAFYGLTNDFIGTPQTLLRLGAQAGITNFLLLPVAMKSVQVRHINQFVLDETRKHSEFIGFGALHPDLENLQQEVDFLLDNGLRGVKIHPDMIRVAIDDPTMLPIYEAIEGRLPILLHTGDPRMDYSHPARLRHVMHMFPQLQVFAAHLGGWSVYDEAVHALRDTDCMVDMSSSLPFLPPEEIVRYIRLYGADRVLFGTDFPIWDPKSETQRFMRLPLTDDEKEKIAYRNACALLGIE